MPTQSFFSSFPLWQLQVSPGHNAAIWSNARGIVSLEILPEGLALNLTESAVLCVAMLESGHNIGKGDASGTFSNLPSPSSGGSTLATVSQGVGQGIGAGIAASVGL